MGRTTLETRRKRGDLIEAFKIIKVFEDVNSKLFFSLAINTAHQRGHELKIVKKGVKLNVRKNFFSQRVVNDWNILPKTVINKMFSNRLDCHLIPLKEHCFCLIYLRLLLYFFIINFWYRK